MLLIFLRSTIIIIIIFIMLYVNVYFTFGIPGRPKGTVVRCEV